MTGVFRWDLLCIFQDCPIFMNLTFVCPFAICFQSRVYCSEFVQICNSTSGTVSPHYKPSIKLIHVKYGRWLTTFERYTTLGVYFFFFQKKKQVIFADMIAIYPPHLSVVIIFWLHIVVRGCQNGGRAKAAVANPATKRVQSVVSQSLIFCP